MTRLSRPAIVLLGILLLAPTLALGFYADDYVHQLVLSGADEDVPMKPWALFDFGVKADWDAMDGSVGTFPWWTDENWKARFLRPLSSVYLWGLHAVFGDWSPGYHLVGLGMHGLLLWLLYGFYLRLGLTASAAKLGTLLFAVCDSAVLPAGWPANSNSLLVAVFSVASLRLLLGQSGTSKLLLGLLLAVAAAASKEAGAVTLALATLVLFGGEGRRARALGFLGLFLCVAYAALLLGGGYGTRSLFYATPWDDPVHFAGNLLVLGSMGPLSLLGPYPLDLVGLFPAARLPAIVVGALVGVPVWTRIVRAVRGAPGTGLLALWAVGFLVVQGAALPSDRLLFLPAIGGLGLLAIFFDESERDLSRGRGLLFLSVTVGSGFFLLVQGAGLSMGAAFLRENVPLTEVGAPELGRRDVYVLQSESQFQAFTLHSMWGFHSDDHELTFWNVQNNNRPLRWTRVDDSAFDVETLGEPFLTGPFEIVYLARTPAVTVGDTWETRAFRVEALAVDGGRPTRLRFRLQRSLDDPRVRFVRAKDGPLVHVEPPAIGASVTLETPARAGPFMP